MKNLILATLCLFQCFLANSTTKTVINSPSSDWADPDSWSPAGVPESGDEIIIPVGEKIIIEKLVYDSPVTLIIRVFGFFEFRPDGELNLSSSSMVILYGTAELNSTGTSSELIYIGGVAKYNGTNDGQILGPRYASLLTGVSTYGTPWEGFTVGTLPVKLLYFTYTILNKTVQLKWKVTQDGKDELYTVQRKNSQGWKDLQSLNGTGSTGSEISYNYIDMAPHAENIYRLKLTGTAGETTYSQSILVKLIEKQLTLSAFPNPTTDVININWQKILNTGNLSVYSSSGALIVERNLIKINEISLPASSFGEGNYVAIIRSENSTIGKIFFTVTH